MKLLKIVKKINISIENLAKLSNLGVRTEELPIIKSVTSLLNK